MNEKFNSGKGGYTCDRCGLLLWSGVGGGLNPAKRRFTYQSQEDIKTRLAKDGLPRFYCVACSEKEKADGRTLHDL